MYMRYYQGVTVGGVALPMYVYDRTALFFSTLFSFCSCRCFIILGRIRSNQQQ